MTRLYLLRHGPTEASASGAPLGHLDLPVNEEGEARWPAVRAVLRALPIQRVLCSPLQRSLRHARDLGLPYTVLDDLREQAFGAWEGRPWVGLGVEATAAFFDDPVRGSPPGGESFAVCAARTVAALETGLKLGEPATLVLAHGGPLRAVLAHMLGLPLDRAMDVAWDPFGLSLIELYAPQRGLLRFHNRALPDGTGHGLLEA